MRSNRVSIRFLQSNRATIVDMYSNSFRIRSCCCYAFKFNILFVSFFIISCYCILYVCTIFYLTIVFVFIIQFVALRRWNSDGSRARPSSHEQENAGRAHRLHPEGSDSGKFSGNARLSRFKMELDKRLETAAIS